MPGEVSRSNPGPKDVKDIRLSWRLHLQKNKIKYFVIKADEFLQALSPSEAKKFNILLRRYERWREGQGKTASNSYYIVNRDEPYAETVKDLIEANEGIKL